MSSESVIVIAVHEQRSESGVTTRYAAKVVWPAEDLLNGQDAFLLMKTHFFGTSEPLWWTTLGRAKTLAGLLRDEHQPEYSDLLVIDVYLASRRVFHLTKQGKPAAFPEQLHQARY